jgi:hypothetical protein
VQTNTTQQVLAQARELISDKNKWGTGCFAEPESWDGKRRLCAMGAIKAVDRSKATECFNTLRDFMKMGVRRFNDSHSHECVLAAFDAAIESLN